MADVRDAYSGELLNVTGQTVTIDGDWFEIAGDPKLNFGQNVPFIVSIKAGTGTVQIQARNTPADTPSQTVSTGVSTTVSGTPWRQFRARVTAVTGSIDAVVSCPFPLRKAS